MSKRIMVSFICWNNEKKKIYEEDMFEKDNIGATRLILGYKPKRGYEVVQVRLDYQEGLVWMDELLKSCMESVFETDEMTDSQKVELLKAIHTIYKYLDIFEGV